MDFIIGVDCDGLACVVGDPGRSLSFSRDFPWAKTQATREADAAARALFDAGADRVLVWDNHGLGANLHYEQLDPRVDVALGTGFDHRWPGIEDGFDAAIMIGYHPMEGTPDGVLAHTYSPDAYAQISANGTPVGEMALDAAVAGAYGVPVIFTATCTRGCEEARRFMPWIETVCTKRGVSNHGAFSKHPAAAAEEIYRGVGRALGRLDEMQTFTFDSPVRLEYRFKKIRQALKARLGRRGWSLAGPKSIRTTLSDMRHYAC